MKVTVKRVTPNKSKYQPDVLKQRIEKKVMNSTERILNNIKFNSPEEDGDMRNSFKASYSWNGNIFTGVITSDCPYLKWHIIGTGKYNPTGRQDVPWLYYDAEHDKYRWTSGIAPNPFIENAVRNEERHLRESVRKAVQDFLRDNK